jgi:H+-transporting ATPase
VLGTQAVATLIAVYGLFMTPLGWDWAGFVWGYALAWFLVNDRVKLLAYRIFDPIKAAPKPEAEPKLEAEPQPAAKVEAEPEAKAKPEINAEPRPAAKTRTQRERASAPRVPELTPYDAPLVCRRARRSTPRGAPHAPRRAIQGASEEAHQLP